MCLSALASSEILALKVCRDVPPGLLSTAETKNLCYPRNPYRQALHFMQHLESQSCNPCLTCPKGVAFCAYIQVTYVTLWHSDLKGLYAGVLCH